MITYKLTKNSLGFVGAVSLLADDIATLSIPFDPANTDYANFKKDLADGAQLKDADGKVIDGIAYLKELA